MWEFSMHTYIEIYISIGILYLTLYGFSYGNGDGIGIVIEVDYNTGYCIPDIETVTDIINICNDRWIEKSSKRTDILCNSCSRNIFRFDLSHRLCMCLYVWE